MDTRLTADTKLTKLARGGWLLKHKWLQQKKQKSLFSQKRILLVRLLFTFARESWKREASELTKSFAATKLETQSWHQPLLLPNQFPGQTTYIEYSQGQYWY